MLTGVVQFGANTVYVLYLATALPASSFGTIVFALSLIALIRGAASSTAIDLILKKNIISCSYTLSIIKSILIILFLGLILGILTLHLASIPTWGMVIFVLLSLLQILYVIPNAILLKLEKFRCIFIAELTAAIISYLLLLPYISSLDNLNELLWVSPILIFYLIRSIITIVQMASVSYNYTDSESISVKEFFRFGAMRLIYILHSHMDNIFIGGLYGTAVLGAYKLAYQLVNIPVLIISKFFEKYLLVFMNKTNLELGTIINNKRNYFLVIICILLVVVNILAYYTAHLIARFFDSTYSDLSSMIIVLCSLIVTRPILKITEIEIRMRQSQKAYLWFVLIQISCVLFAMFLGMLTNVFIFCAALAASLSGFAIFVVTRR